ncbi:hypothetical protein B0H14DRAFT_2880669, partial [Mycena olivaceomarginata]
MLIFRVSTREAARRAVALVAMGWARRRRVVGPGPGDVGGCAGCRAWGLCTASVAGCSTPATVCCLVVYAVAVVLVVFPELLDGAVDGPLAGEATCLGELLLNLNISITKARNKMAHTRIIGLRKLFEPLGLPTCIPIEAAEHAPEPSSTVSYPSPIPAVSPASEFLKHFWAVDRFVRDLWRRRQRLHSSETSLGTGVLGTSGLNVPDNIAIATL